LRPGGAAIYRVSVTNNGHRTVPAGTTVKITLPSSVTPRIRVAFGWQCQKTGHVLDCQLGRALRPHHRWSLGIVGTISSDASGALTVTAKIEPSGPTATEVDWLTGRDWLAARRR
jgi:hypothetical protein